jgi:poly(3-hydroxybutyrate) depolymerase
MALLAMPSVGAQKIVSAKYESEFAERHYSLYVPARAQSHRPLVIVLHGSGGTAREMVEKWRPIADREGIVVAGPDAANRSEWRPPKDGPALLRDLENEMDPELIDRRRVYLFGHSAGGIFSLYMGSRLLKHRS